MGIITSLPLTSAHLHARKRAFVQRLVVFRCAGPYKGEHTTSTRQPPLPPAVVAGKRVRGPTCRFAKTSQSITPPKVSQILVAGQTTHQFGERHGAADSG